MFCPNCGKKVLKNDNFCRYCGSSLNNAEQTQYIFEDESPENVSDLDTEEEFVLYEVKKHSASLFWAIILIPFFIFYFWTIFLNTYSFFSWIIMFALLGFIIYPAMRFKSDKIIITNKFAHVKIGVVNSEETDIPLNRFNRFEISQGSFGKMFGFGALALLSDSGRIEYGYIEAPEDFQYIIDNPERFVREAMSEDTSVSRY